MPKQPIQDDYKKYAFRVLIPATILLVLAFIPITFLYVMANDSGSAQAMLISSFIFAGPYIVVIIGWIFYIVGKYRYAFLIPIYYLLFMIAIFFIMITFEQVYRQTGNR